MGSAYVDENETIYYMDKTVGVGLSGGNTVSLFFDINQHPLDELITGQSTVFVNSVKFKCSGFIDPDGIDLNRTVGKIVCGVVPFDLFNISNAPHDLEDYQELKGWPLKGCYGYTSLMRPRDTEVSESNWQGLGSTFSWQKTYKPRNSLLISRMQSICFTLQNDVSNGSDINYCLSMEVQCKRGD